MFLSTDTQRTNLIDDYLEVWAQAFVVDRRARGAAAGTITFSAAKNKSHKPTESPKMNATGARHDLWARNDVISSKAHSRRVHRYQC
jgi:hypothetical protein